MACVAAGAHAQTPFYIATDQELAGAPGTIIRAEAMRGAPEGAAAYRCFIAPSGCMISRLPFQA